MGIGPCREIAEPPPGCQIVTGTFVTEQAAIVRVWLEGAAEPIGATLTHPFYSEDRAAWTGAAELHEGEMVRTLDGIARVQRIEPMADPAAVYNFEVCHTHTYYVGDGKAWVHNPCFGSRAGEAGKFKESIAGEVVLFNWTNRGKTLIVDNLQWVGGGGVAAARNAKKYLMAIARREKFTRAVVRLERIDQRTGEIKAILEEVIDLTTP